MSNLISSPSFVAKKPHDWRWSLKLSLSLQLREHGSPESLEWRLILRENVRHGKWPEVISAYKTTKRWRVPCCGVSDRVTAVGVAVDKCPRTCWEAWSLIYFCLCIRPRKCYVNTHQVVQFSHLHLVVSFTASGNANTELTISLERELALSFEELRQVMEVSYSGSDFDVHLIFIITDPISVQQSLDHKNTCIYVLKKGSLSPPHTKERALDRCSLWTNWLLSFLYRAFS